MTEDRVAAKYTRAGRAQTILILFTSVCVIAALGLLMYNSTIAKASRSDQEQALQLLIECTTAPALRDPPETHVPKTDCYTRQQDASATFTAPDSPYASLIGAAASCGAAHPNDIPATLQCVLVALK